MTALESKYIPKEMESNIYWSNHADVHYDDKDLGRIVKESKETVLPFIVPIIRSIVEKI